MEDILKEFQEVRTHFDTLMGLLKPKEEQLASLSQIEGQLQEFRRQFAESQWYLGEEKSRREQLSNAVDGYQKKCRDLESQLEELRLRCAQLEKDLSDTKWYLGEERARRQQLEGQNK